jgi:hypothetical protein
MPSLKLCEKEKPTYGGFQGKQLFYDSINFLFSIKSIEFSKYNPSFLTPSVDEFLSFVLCNKKGGDKKYNYLRHFLQYIADDMNIDDNILLSIYIVQFALASYTLTDYILTGQDEISDKWLGAFIWFSSNFLQEFCLNRDILIITVERYLDSVYFDDILSIVKNYNSDITDLYSIGQYIMFTLKKRNNISKYDRYVQFPLTINWYKLGIKKYEAWMLRKVRSMCW